MVMLTSRQLKPGELVIAWDDIAIPYGAGSDPRKVTDEVLVLEVKDDGDVVVLDHGQPVTLSRALKFQIAPSEKQT